MTVLIAGGGIAGLTLGLTCHQIGIPFKIFESAASLRPLGVGINLQPVAVRELYDLGIKSQLDEIGIKTKDFSLITHLGREIWTEPRGINAGYNWPQYSVHRGKLQMLLHSELISRAGSDCFVSGNSVIGFDNLSNCIRIKTKNKSDDVRYAEGEILIGADGIHSAIRKQIHPIEAPPSWTGSILWRGTSKAPPFKSGASMIIVGKKGLRFVCYPISRQDQKSGNIELNWIAHVKFKTTDYTPKESWSNQAELDDFYPYFEDFSLEWLDIPNLIKKSTSIFEYPLLDRDPLDFWRSGRATLMGDAAHAASPVGSNGAGAAILDARKLGAMFLKHGVTPKALESYENDMRPITSKIIIQNRENGPDAILDHFDNGMPNQSEQNFENDKSTLAEHAEKYKQLAGTSVQQANENPPLIVQ